MLLGLITSRPNSRPSSKLGRKAVVSYKLYYSIAHPIVMRWLWPIDFRGLRFDLRCSLQFIRANSNAHN